MNERYAVEDAQGNRLTAGLQGEHQARIVAQRIANDLGQPVYLYQTGEDEEHSETIEIAPNVFTPTHIITPTGREPIPVMLIEGAAYTEAEAESFSTADYERQDDGAWTFQGQPFDGTVEPIKKETK